MLLWFPDEVLLMSKLTLLTTLLFFFAVGCDAIANIRGPKVETLVVINDGAFHSFSLPQGTHHLSLTATNDGVTVEWLGGSCPGTNRSATKLHNETCALTQPGQLVISNPNTVGALSKLFGGSGSDSSVSITIK